MRYQVPQFIEVEDKIFGPLTIKQFVYLAGAGGITLIFVTLFPLYLALVLAAPFITLSVALAFVVINGRPFIVALEHFFYYLTGTKLYLWHDKRQDKKPEEALKALPKGPVLQAPKLSESKLKDLAWSLNIQDRKKMGVDTRATSEFQI